MKRFADMVLGGNQGTPTITAFRNANFSIHIGCIEDANGLPLAGLTGLKYEYLKPTDFQRTKWLQDVTGEKWTAIPGTNYTDLNPANRAAMIRAELKWCAQIKTDHLHLDCIMECPKGREDDSAALVEEFAAAGFTVMPNNGDPYTAGIKDEKTPWGRINKAASVICIQVGIDLGNYNFSRMVYTMAVVNSYVAAGKPVIVGVFDQDGKHQAQAEQFFGAAIFDNPLVFGHYCTSYDSKASVMLQIPGGKP